MCTDDDRVFMQAAIDASRQALAAGNMPFGASLVKNGHTLWTAQNKQRTASDCTGHAEVVLVREARQALGHETTVGATVYASGEPCAMCAGAMFWAGIRRVVFGATTPDIEAALGGPSLPMRCADALAGAQPAVQVDGPMLRDEAVAVLRAWRPPA
ncbi:MAG: nucleoside deaminase [Rubrivivax sp.]|nr:MAG: nucleoside deaminase [Rubrivivax sp.]